MIATILGGEKDETDDITKSSSAESIHQSTPVGTANSTPVPPRTASIRQRPTSTRLNHTKLEELFQKQKDSDTLSQNSLMTSSKFQGSNTISSPTKGRVYASVAEMKRVKSKVRKGIFISFPIVRLSSSFQLKNYIISQRNRSSRFGPCLDEKISFRQHLYGFYRRVKKATVSWRVSKCGFSLWFSLEVALALALFTLLKNLHAIVGKMIPAKSVRRISFINSDSESVHTQWHYCFSKYSPQWSAYF